ncbi:MAG: RING finger protein [Planctomycetota bacterium]
MARCSICHTLIRAGEAATACPECRQDYHESCWTELGGCATYGCRRTVPAEKAPAPQQLYGGWGDTKECPRCRREIGASLVVCHCGARFPDADPMTSDEYRTWSRLEEERARTRRTLVLLLLFSLVGLPAPLLGPIAGVVAHRKKALLAGADGTYLAMGYGTAILGATYTLFILLLLMGL